MNTYITPNETIRDSDSQSIRAAIELALANGTRRVRIPRRNDRTGEERWSIDETIALPSDIEILIDDAHLILAEGKYLNMFTTGTPGSSEEIRNVTLHGRGRAILDGGIYNGLSEKNSCTEGRPHIHKNTTLLFFNTSNLTVENLSLINQRWWAITNVYVHHAVYRNIHFKADYSRVDENDIHHPDEAPRHYKEIYIKNADGIDLRIGCHDFLIENISGFTEDDSIALTALGGWERKYGYAVEEAAPDIHDVMIHNISTDSRCANVRLLNDNGNKLYNITVDGVTSLHTSDLYRSNSAVRIGDMIYAQTHSELGDTHHITVRNVISEAEYAVSLCKGLVDSVIENVTVLGGSCGVSTYKDYPATLQRCRIERIFPIAPGSDAIRSDNITFLE